MAYPVLVHRPQEGGRPADIGVVVLDRHPRRLADGLQSGEVYDSVHRVAVEDCRKGVPITDVQLVHGADESAA